MEEEVGGEGVCVYMYISFEREREQLASLPNLFAAAVQI
jgi:hypothetical protein